MFKIWLYIYIYHIHTYIYVYSVAIWLKPLASPRGYQGSQRQPKRLDMVTRAPRPLVSHFYPQALVQDLTDLAKLKHPGFQWDGSGYQASKRSDLGDTEALAKHMVPLTILLKMCSTGFPSHPNLRQALTMLQAKHHIFKECSNVFKVASNAADQWRLMCRHIYNRRREGNQEPLLSGLVDLIVLPSNTSAAEDTFGEEELPPLEEDLSTVSALVPTNQTLASSQDGILDPERVNSLFPTFEDSLMVQDDLEDSQRTLSWSEEDDCMMLGYKEAEVRVISQKCMCPACRPTKAMPPETPTAETFRH